MSLRLAALATVFALSVQSAPPSAAPQGTKPAPQQPPVFRSGAEMVRVDVTVLDSHGHPARDLRVEDFEVAEDDRPQKVESFALVDLGEPAADGRDLEISSR